MLEEGYNKPKYCQQVSNVLEGDNSVDFFSETDDNPMEEYKQEIKQWDEAALVLYYSTSDHFPQSNT